MHESQNEIADLTIAGTLHASSYVVSESLVVVSSGSTIFGNTSDDIHQFTGSLHVCGSTATTTALIKINQSGDGNFIEIRGDSGSKALRLQQSTHGGAVLDIFGSGSVSNIISH